MTQTFIRILVVAAWFQEKDGEPGYAVRSSDGSVSWVPTDEFELTSRPMRQDEAETVRIYGAATSEEEVAQAQSAEAEQGA